MNNQFVSKSFLKALLCAHIALSVTFWGHFSFATQKTDTCSALLSQIELPQNTQLNQSQVERLKAVLEALPTDKKEQLFNSLSEVDMNELAEALREEKSHPLIESLNANPEKLLLVKDLVELSQAFPGIFSLTHSQQAVTKVLDLVRKTEVESKLNHPDLLASIGMTGRLHGRLNSLVANLIQQATVDYLGMRFPNDEGLSYLWYRVKRFFFPTYHPVNQAKNWIQDVQKQLHRLLVVDQLITRLALSETVTLGLTDSEVERLMAYVINSPDEIKELEKLTADVLQAKEVGQFDIYAIAKRIKSLNMDQLEEQFDHLNIKSLDEMDRVLNAALARKGNTARNESAYPVEELQIRIEASDRAVDRHQERYFDSTSQISNESYSVERRYTVQVPDGRDAKGNMKYRSETRYRSEIVRPSFENILSRNFDTGDRSVSGLTQIQARSEKLAQKEAAPRSIMNKAEEFIIQTFNGHADRLVKGTTLEVVAPAKELAEELKERIKAQTSYLKWSESQIRNQYDKDSIENFRRRNKEMLLRLQSAHTLVTLLAEASKRSLPSLSPVYDLYEFDKWLTQLRRHRNVNYGIKSGMSLLTVGGVSLTHPDVQGFLLRHGMDVQGWFQQAAQVFN